MDHSPLSLFSASDVSRSSAVPVSILPQSPTGLEAGSETGSEASDPVARIAAMRESLASGTSSASAIFRAATDTARVLSGADGAALALRTDGIIVCRARSGALAPELGSPLSVGSGISGECMITATVLVCTDAATDSRVDPEVCLSLGIRSIVAVPLRTATGIVGILEAFSTRPCAFGAEQIEALRAMAEIAERTYEREGMSGNSTRVRPSSADRRAHRLPPVAADKILDSASDTWSGRRGYWIFGVTAVAVLLVSLVVWLSWRQPGADSIARGGTAHSLSARPNASASPLVVVKAEAPIAARASDHWTKDHWTKNENIVQNAAQVQPIAPDTPQSNPAADAASISAASISEDRVEDTAAVPGQQAATDDPTPSIEVATSEVATSVIPEELASWSSTTAALPAFGSSVSQGATEGSLIHKVDPIYPQEARTQKLAGTVILDATIGKDGSVDRMKVIDGPTVLAKAATAALRQWRYSPSTLNGNPIEVEKRITVIFKLP
jgi:TonB family protein